MTDNERTEREMVEVTQADRDAADAFYDRAADVLGPIKDRPADCPMTIRDALDEAFARHRIAALRPAPVDGLAQRLGELAAKATPGPWETDTLKSEGSYGCGDDTHEGFTTTAIYDSDGRVLLDALNSDVALVQDDWDDDGFHHAHDLTSAANATLIVELVNNLPSILTALRAQSDVEAERDGDCWIIARKDALGAWYVYAMPGTELIAVIQEAESAMDAIRQALERSAK